jgi:hypothetical protein
MIICFKGKLLRRTPYFLEDQGLVIEGSLIEPGRDYPCLC